MSIFQCIALSVLGLLVLWEVWGWWRRRSRWGVGAVRCLVWLAAAAAIAFPNAVQEVATSIGIGRGADAVLYLFVLAFLGAAFYFYSRSVKLERRLTELVRHIAIQESRRGGGR
jgi:hypothetical protein